ncbi:hypothetical protein [Herbaspirillum rubrisubalbicans]
MFGKLIAVTDSCGAWRAFEDGLCGYLGL